MGIKMMYRSTLLRREQLSAALREAGYPLPSKGGPPIARRIGATPVYAWGQAIEWAQRHAANRRRAGRPKGSGSRS
jgi:hypothetical protein